MGFQQQILDQLFIAFITSIASLAIVIPSNFIGLYFPFIGLSFVFFGTGYLFYLLYIYYYQKKFHPITPPYLFLWWIYLTISFSLVFSLPIFITFKWRFANMEIFLMINSLVAFISFELYSYRLSLKNWLGNLSD